MSAGRPVRALVAVAVGLVVADASVVTLALPHLLGALHTTVEGVAAVLGVYTAVLALAVLAAGRWPGDPGRRGRAGLAAFAAACAGCAAARSLPVLLAFRAAQAVGGGVALAAAFDLLDVPGPGRRGWTAAAVFGTAAGPAFGGALTQALDWQAIFIGQVPVALAAALACGRAGGGAAADGPPPAGDRAAGIAPPLWPAVALALVSAALTAVLFLAVLLLVAGWSLSPLSAAAVVTVLPVAAIAAHAWGPAGAGRAAAGCALVAAGIGCLAFLPTASAWWVVAPQALAGAGMGLALPALSAGVGEDGVRRAARGLAIRHAGITLALALLAPVVAADLDAATERAQLRGTALVLDAPVAPLAKLELASRLFSAVRSDRPRAALADVVAARLSGSSGRDRAAVASLGRRADQTLVRAVGEAFRAAFEITAGLALLAALVLVAGARQARRRPAGRALALALVACLAAPAGYAAAYAAVAPAPPRLADPCRPRTVPETGGLGGLVQEGALRALDRVACRLGSSREELVLALIDAGAAREYRRRHGVDPRSLVSLLGALLPRGGMGGVLGALLGG